MEKRTEGWWGGVRVSEYPFSQFSGKSFNLSQIEIWNFPAWGEEQNGFASNKIDAFVL